MAIISLMVGGLVGFLAAIVAWLALGFAPLMALTLYVTISLGIGLFPFALCALRSAVRGNLVQALGSR